MNVICHQHIGVQTAIMFFATLRKKIQVKLIIGIGKEARIAVIAPLRDMLRNSWQVQSNWARQSDVSVVRKHHFPKEPGDRELQNQPIVYR